MYYNNCKRYIIFIGWVVEGSGWLFWRFKVTGSNIFTDSLISAIIQDGSKREGSGHMSLYCPRNQKREKKK